MLMWQTAELLARATAIDNRTVTQETVEAWHGVVGHLDYSLALEALNAHYRVSDKWVMPANIVDQAEHLLEIQALELPRLPVEELELCRRAGIAPEEFSERFDEPGWVESLRERLGIERGNNDNS